MTKITTTHKIGAGAILILVASCTVYIFFYKYINSLRDELISINKELAVTEALARNRQETELLLTSTADERAILKGRFVSTEDPTPFLELIESSARDTGVVLEVKTLTVEEVGEKKDSKVDGKKVALTLAVESGWKELYHFLTLLERLPYSVTISRTALSFEERSEGNVWEGQIQLQCNAQ